MKRLAARFIFKISRKNRPFSMINENLSPSASFKNHSRKNAQKALTEAGLRPIMLLLLDTASVSVGIFPSPIDRPPVSGIFMNNRS